MGKRSKNIKLSEEKIIELFLDSTDQIWSYLSLPELFIGSNLTRENRIIVKFYDYNNEAAWKVADIVRPVLFLSNDPIYWKRIIDAVKSLGNDKTINRASQFEDKIAEWKNYNIFGPSENDSLYNLNRSKDAKISIYHNRKILTEDRMLTDFRSGWIYAHMVLYKYKWHSQYDKTYENFSPFEKKISLISTVNLLIRSIDIIQILRNLCTEVKNGGNVTIKNIKQCQSNKSNKKEEYKALSVISQGSIWQGPFIESPSNMMIAAAGSILDNTPRNQLFYIEKFCKKGVFGDVVIPNVFAYCRRGSVENYEKNGIEYTKLSRVSDIMGNAVVLFNPDLIQSGRMMQGMEPWHKALQN